MEYYTVREDTYKVSIEKLYYQIKKNSITLDSMNFVVKHKNI